MHAHPTAGFLPPRAAIHPALRSFGVDVALTVMRVTAYAAALALLAAGAVALIEVLPDAVAQAGLVPSAMTADADGLALRGTVR